jgi:hypothetical protein
MGNPIRSGIAATRALSATPKDALVQPNGSLVPEPEAGQVSNALDHVASTLNTVTKAFEVEMEGTGPAGRVTPIRSEPPPQPKQPRLPTPPGAAPFPPDKDASATRAAKQKKVGSRRSPELAPSRSRSVDRRSSPDRRQQAPIPVPLQTVERETKGLGLRHLFPHPSPGRRRERRTLLGRNSRHTPPHGSSNTLSRPLSAALEQRPAFWHSKNRRTRSL